MDNTAMSGECNICGEHHTEGICPLAPPGSKLAREHNCTCPVIDNHYGAGVYTNADGVREYWINSECQLHGNRGYIGTLEELDE